MNKKKIIKLIKGHLDDRKKKKVIEWLLKDPKAQKFYRLKKAEYIARSLSKGTGIKYYGLNFSNIVKYAVVLAVFLSVWLFVRYTIEGKGDIVENNIILVITAIGEKKEIILSDGTGIIVNANSTLSYPREFIGDNREVVLKGEAYFEVAENKEKPFIVRTNEGMYIRVLGTCFNVKSYPEDPRIETTLVSGKVEVVERKDNKTVFLYPSQRATYIKPDDKLIIDKVNTEDFISWKEGKLIYDETPLSEVVKDLERTYNVTFIIESKEILDYKYKGVFDNLTVQEILDLFELSSPLKCTLKDKYVKLEIQK